MCGHVVRVIFEYESALRALCIVNKVSTRGDIMSRGTAHVHETNAHYQRQTFKTLRMGTLSSSELKLELLFVLLKNDCEDTCESSDTTMTLVSSLN